MSVSQYTSTRWPSILIGEQAGNWDHATSRGGLTNSRPPSRLRLLRSCAAASRRGRPPTLAGYGRAAGLPPRTSAALVPPWSYSFGSAPRAGPAWVGPRQTATRPLRCVGVGPPRCARLAARNCPVVAPDQHVKADLPLSSGQPVLSEPTVSSVSEQPYPSKSRVSNNNQRNVRSPWQVE